MIATDKRNAIFLLHQEGMPASEIARKLGVSRNTVRDIIRQGGVRPPRVRTDKKRLDEELLRRLYHQCQGRVARLHEKLVEEEGITVCYSTLTQMLRDLGISTQSLRQWNKQLAIFLRTMGAGLFSADGPASCSGIDARFFPHGFRPRR